MGILYFSLIAFFLTCIFYILLEIDDKPINYIFDGKDWPDSYKKFMRTQKSLIEKDKLKVTTIKDPKNNCERFVNMYEPESELGEKLKEDIAKMGKKMREDELMKEVYEILNKENQNEKS